MTFTYFLMNILPTFAAPLLLAGYIPQIIKTYKTKDVTGISKSFWVMLSTALACVLIAQITAFVTVGTWGLMVKEIINFIPAFAMMIMVLKYGGKNHKGESATN